MNTRQHFPKGEKVCVHNPLVSFIIASIATLYFLFFEGCVVGAVSLAVQFWRSTFFKFSRIFIYSCTKPVGYFSVFLCSWAPSFHPVCRRSCLAIRTLSATWTPQSTQCQTASGRSWSSWNTVKVQPVFTMWPPCFILYSFIEVLVSVIIRDFWFSVRSGLEFFRTKNPSYFPVMVVNDVWSS